MYSPNRKPETLNPKKPEGVETFPKKSSKGVETFRELRGQLSFFQPGLGLIGFRVWKDVLAGSAEVTEASRASSYGASMAAGS